MRPALMNARLTVFPGGISNVLARQRLRLGQTIGAEVGPGEVRALRHGELRLHHRMLLHEQP